MWVYTYVISRYLSKYFSKKYWRLLRGSDISAHGAEKEPRRDDTSPNRGRRSRAAASIWWPKNTEMTNESHFHLLLSKSYLIPGVKLGGCDCTNFLIISSEGLMIFRRASKDSWNDTEPPIAWFVLQWKHNLNLHNRNNLNENFAASYANNPVW